MSDERTGPARVVCHAVEVHNTAGVHLRTHLQPGGRYWPIGGYPVHPLYGAADAYGVIHHKAVA